MRLTGINTNGFRRLAMIETLQELEAKLNDAMNTAYVAIGEDDVGFNEIQALYDDLNRARIRLKDLMSHTDERIARVAIGPYTKFDPSTPVDTLADTMSINPPKEFDFDRANDPMFNALTQLQFVVNDAVAQSEDRGTIPQALADIRDIAAQALETYAGGIYG